ncbi:MAG: RHS repeat-associated core domain-containing protein [Chloroflexota bacterium]|nr:RHS repeat-associated core domain-containing protein [Chloroflexota bacterium]
MHASGAEVTNSRTLYYPYGGQRNEAGIGLMDYNARFYDPFLGRFISADTIVPEPGNPQSLNRYSYVLGNPLKYRDPSGHWADTVIDIISIGITVNDIQQNGWNWENGISLAADVASLALPVVAGGGIPCCHENR